MGLYHLVISDRIILCHRFSSWLHRQKDPPMVRKTVKYFHIDNYVYRSYVTHICSYSHLIDKPSFLCFAIALAVSLYQLVMLANLNKNLISIIYILVVFNEYDRFLRQ